MDQSIILTNAYSRARRDEGGIEMAYVLTLMPRAGVVVLRIHHHDYAYIDGALIAGGSGDVKLGSRPIEVSGVAGGNCPALEMDRPVRFRAVVGVLVEVKDGQAARTEEMWLGAEAELSKGETNHAIQLAPIDKPADLGIAFDS